MKVEHVTAYLSIGHGRMHPETTLRCETRRVHSIYCVSTQWACDWSLRHCWLMYIISTKWLFMYGVNESTLFSCWCIMCLPCCHVRVQAFSTNNSHHSTPPISAPRTKVSKFWIRKSENEHRHNMIIGYAQVHPTNLPGQLASLSAMYRSRVCDLGGVQVERMRC